MHQFRPARNLSIDSILDQLRAICAVLLVMLPGLTGASFAQQRLRLGKVEFAGLKHLTTEQVIATSGLEIGQVVDQKILDAASQKLIDSGLFKKLSYNLHAVRDQAIVTFRVEEATRRLPALFDNFVWFTDEEIYVAVRRDITFFDGTVPEDGDTADKIAASLRHLLNEKKIPGEVEYMPYENLVTGKRELLFNVKGGNTSVCALHFPGADAIPESDLLKASRSLIKRDYSRKDISQFTLYTLYPLYRHLGRLGAKFSDPSAKLETTEDCKDGVTVEIPVDEGAAYSWDRAEWTGNQAFTADELTAALGMKAGEVADGERIDKGVRALAKLYSRKGYLEVGFKESFDLDEQTKLATFRFAVREGPQYRMGELTINGLSDEDSRRVKELWQMAPGSVFDSSYVDDFMAKSIRDFLSKHPVFSGVPLKFGAETKPDHKTKTANVIITFK